MHRSRPVPFKGKWWMTWLGFTQRSNDKPGGNPAFVSGSSAFAGAACVPQPRGPAQASRTRRQREAVSDAPARGPGAFPSLGILNGCLSVCPPPCLPLCLPISFSPSSRRPLLLPFRPGYTEPSCLLRLLLSHSCSVIACLGWPGRFCGRDTGRQQLRPLVGEGRRGPPPYSRFLGLNASAGTGGQDERCCRSAPPRESPLAGPQKAGEPPDGGRRAGKVEAGVLGQILQTLNLLTGFFRFA